MALAEKDKKLLVAFAIGCFVCIASAPVLCSSLLNTGHDLLFHLYRIDGIAEGLKSGQFPVRFQETQVNGLMYPVSIMYGDLFLYFPAVLRCMGFSAHAAYNAYMLVVNAFCAVMTFITFKRMFQSRAIGLLASCLWTLSAYRLFTDTWLRSAVGEYTALVFLPMIIYGLYSLWQYGKTEGATKHAWLWLALGTAGIVYCHVLSILMALLTFAPMLFLLIVFRHDCYVWTQLLKAVFATFALSIAFLVPFADYYMNADLAVVALDSDSKIRDVSGQALLLPQLLMIFSTVAGKATALQYGMSEMPASLGLGIIAGSVIAVLFAVIPSLRVTRSRKQRLAIGLLVVEAVFFLLATSVYFPWSYGVSGGFAGKFVSLIGTIQFPWRFVGVASILLIALISTVLIGVSRKWRPVFYGAVGLLIVFSCLEAGVACTSYLSEAKSIPEDYTMITAESGTKDNWREDIGSGEYLPEGCSLTRLLSEELQQPQVRGTASIADWSKSEGKIELDVEGGSTGGSLTVPLLSYPYFVALSDSGESLEVHRDSSGLIEVVVPASFKGHLTVGFDEPLAWRIAFTASFFAAAVLAICAVSCGVKKLLRLSRAV